MSEAAVKQKVPFGVKLGYSVGIGGDSIPYNLFFTYFLFFLTDIAGIAPAIAGIISFISICWDAVTDPVMGYVSDTWNGKYGRRRPFMIGSMLPLALVVYLMFVPIKSSGGVRVAYYLIVAILLWTFYTIYVVPWAALGAELTQNFKERNILRLLGAFIAYPLVALCNSGPMAVINFGMQRGWTIHQCWHLTGGLAAVLIVILSIISWRVTRGREIVRTQEEIKMSKEKNILRQFKEVLSMKTYRILVFMGVIYVIGFIMGNSAAVYLLTHNAKMHPGQQGLFWLLYSVFAMVFSPIPVFIANKIGRKKSFLIFGFLYVVNSVVFFILGIHNMAGMLVYGAFIALSTSCYWGLYFAFVYDVAELDEFKHNTRREGSIIAIAQFFQKFGGGIATSLVGVILQLFGYTGSGVESAQAVKGILAVSTIIPGAIVFVSMIVFFAYPLTRKRYESLKEAIELKKAGKEFSTEGFKEVL